MSTKKVKKNTFFLLFLKSNTISYSYESFFIIYFKSRESFLNNDLFFLMLIMKINQNTSGTDALITHVTPKILILILFSFLAFSLQSNTPERDKITNAKTYVFVHGAGGGGWDWKALGNLLANRGHSIHRITLTGLGERAHLSNSSINLTTHINDVTNTIVFDKLKNIVLVGHSYGGMVITGVMNKLPKSIRHAVFLDAAVPKHNMSAVEFWPSINKHQIRDGLVYFSWLKPNSLPPHDVPQSLASFTESVEFNNELAHNIPATYIEFTDNVDEFNSDTSVSKSWKIAESRGWSLIAIESDHNAQRSNPVLLANLLEHISD